MSKRYTEGIAGDGVVILDNGTPITITEILNRLNDTTRATKNCSIPDVSNRLLAEKIILSLDDYGRKTHSVEYGLPIDPDTNFESEKPQEMLKIVTDILNVD